MRKSKRLLLCAYEGVGTSTAWQARMIAQSKTKCDVETFMRCLYG